MALQNPVAVYDAANDVEAQLICNLLNESGVEAFATTDTQVGQFPKPQVWVDRGAIDRAKPICRTTNTSHNSNPPATSSSVLLSRSSLSSWEHWDLIGACCGRQRGESRSDGNGKLKT